MQTTSHTSPRIAFGQNAGQPRPITDIVIDGLTKCRDAAIKLKRNGYTVISCITDNALPPVQIQACRKTAEMIDLGAACYYRWRTVDGERERHGQFHIEGVRVIWVERGYP